MHRPVFQAIFVVALTLSAVTAAAVEPWIITSDVVVGFHLPDSVIFEDLRNNRTYDQALWVFDRELTLVNASIDTWDLWPAEEARVTVRDSVVGEILSFGAYDRGRLLADQTPINTTPALGGDGVIGVTWSSGPQTKARRPRARRQTGGRGRRAF